MSNGLKVSEIYNEKPEMVSSDCLIVGVYQGEEKDLNIFRFLDPSTLKHFSRLIRESEISGSSEISTMVYTLGHAVPTRILFAGLGLKSLLGPDGLRNIMAKCFRKCRELKLKKISIDLDSFCSESIGPLETAECLTSSAIMGLYVYDDFKTDKLTGFPEDIRLVCSGQFPMEKAFGDAIRKGNIIADSVNLARDLANAPANYMTPTKLSEVALQLAEGSSLGVEILEEEDMKKLSMGALVGVSKGSVEPAKLICLTHKGSLDQPDNNLALIGKGITFDSGGLNLKSALGMRNMKGDMAGGAAVMGAMKAIHALNLKVNVMGLIPATENMPGNEAQRPGDIVRAMNSVTIEIDNTDAEGRLVLADALCFAEQKGFTRIIDVATLTGAVRTALGDKYIGIFGNDPVFTSEVLKAGNCQGEKMWELPTDHGYLEQLNSDVADIKNSGGPSAGSITGAMFIGKFADKASWVHLDIAAVSKIMSVVGYQVKGATGVGVRSLIYLCELRSN